MTRALMFQGTGSDVGKTVLVAGLCRAARNRGLKVLPFKPQNMSNNAAVAQDGKGGSGEIGRAQWLQALACGVAASVHMNPVLLKPQSEQGSQVVVLGKVLTNAKARDYQNLKPKLLKAVLNSFARVSAEADLVLVEGAGSPAEINLRAGDIANMGFATKANVPVVLIGDIDRGGVIASLVGTHAILPAADRRMVAGFLINKFRGDVSLFDEGLAKITEYTGWRSFGVLPWTDAARRLPAEDSVALDHLVDGNKPGGVTIAVPVLPRISNFDDFDALKNEPGVDLVFVRPGQRLPANAKLVILPGSKSTISDLAALREQGWDADLRRHVERGGKVIGICGGYQMLGHEIHDPHRAEGSAGKADGLGFLNVETVLSGEKTVRETNARSIDGDLPLAGYEIHLGETFGADCTRPMIRIGDRDDGAVSPDGNISGCYLHRLFDSDAYRRRYLESLGAQAGKFSLRHDLELALDELAEAMETHLDIDNLLASARTMRKFDRISA